MDVILKRQIRAVLTGIKHLSVDEADDVIMAVCDESDPGDFMDAAILDGLRWGYRAAVTVELAGGALLRAIMPGGVAITHEWAVAADAEPKIEAAFAALDPARSPVQPHSPGAMETCLRDVCLPALRRTAEDLFRCVSVRNDPASVSPADWRDIADDMEAVLAVEAIVGRPDDEYGRILNPVLNAAPWRAHR